MPIFPSPPSRRAERTWRARHAERKRSACMLALDCVLACILLVVFALSHHALPQALMPTGAESAAVTVMAGARAASVTRFTLPDASAAGATLQTDTRHESDSVQVTLTTQRRGRSVCHVQDIYVQSVENLRCAFADGVYGKGVRAHPLDMAAENNAICAINGDYYGASAETGAVIRNGKLYRDNPSNDVLVLYFDGHMRVVEKAAFDGESELAGGAYQAWCFGPSLLSESGASLTSFQTDKRIGRSNPRTVIGYYAPGHYCFLTVDGRSENSGGMTLAELSAFCESLGLSLAYNLDGGRTSVMTFHGRVVNEPSEGGRKSSDIIYICETGGTK